MAFNLSFLSDPIANNVRAVLYAGIPAVIAVLVSSGKMTQDHANLWIALALAVFSPAFASIRTKNGLRTWAFGVLAAVQLVLVGLGILTNQQITPLIAIVTAIIGGGIAAANVHTTSNTQGAPGNSA